MTDDRASRADTTAEAIASVLRERFGGDVSASADVEGRARLVGAVSAREAGRRRTTGRALALLGGLGAMAAVTAIVFAPRAALTYETVDLARAGGVSGALVARDDGHAGTVRFSDGSTLSLAPRGRARVSHTSWRGVEVALDDGRADLDVVPRRLARWVVTAGPYHVRVTGTRFSVAWSPGARTFELAMRSGTVKVEGPGVHGTLALREGDRLVADEGRGTSSVQRIEDRPAATSPVRKEVEAPAPVQVAAPAEEPAPRAAKSVPVRPAATRDARVSWSERVASGDFDRVLREASARPVDDVLRTATLPELNALADAARYTGRDELAARALTAERRRFPSTAPASMAAFLLGRLAEDHGRADEAVRWYERYLSEAPRGAFAAEALGRQMLASKRDPDRARELARGYLQRFPQGPYAAVAKSLLGER